MSDGLLVVYKPIGLSSHDVIDKIRRIYRLKCGHAGTLDPMAQGVLLVFTGRALKLINFITPDHLDKTYLMKVTLGSTTDTYDATGQVTSTCSEPINFSNEDLIAELRNFVGSYEQIPPAFSAIKVGGKRAYALARAGEEVKLTGRKVHVTSIRLVSDYISAEQRHLIMRVHCSRGTYVRSIAHDLGQRLGCGGHLSYLLRERSANGLSAAPFLSGKSRKALILQPHRHLSILPTFCRFPGCTSAAKAKLKFVTVCPSASRTLSRLKEKRSTVKMPARCRSFRRPEN